MGKLFMKLPQDEVIVAQYVNSLCHVHHSVGSVKVRCFITFLKFKEDSKLFFGDREVIVVQVKAFCN